MITGEVLPPKITGLDGKEYSRHSPISEETRRESRLHTIRQETPHLAERVDSGEIDQDEAWELHERQILAWGTSEDFWIVAELHDNVVAFFPDPAAFWANYDPACNRLADKQPEAFTPEAIHRIGDWLVRLAAIMKQPADANGGGS